MYFSLELIEEATNCSRYDFLFVKIKELKELVICKFVSKRYLFLKFGLHFCVSPCILGYHCTYSRTKAKVIKSRSMAFVFFERLWEYLGCNDNHTYIRFYTKKFFCFYRIVYTKIPNSFHTGLLTFGQSPISLIDGLMALVFFA